MTVTREESPRNRAEATQQELHTAVLPGWWRLTLIALASVILSACQSMESPHANVARNGRQPMPNGMNSQMNNLSPETSNYSPTTMANAQRMPHVRNAGGVISVGYSEPIANDGSFSGAYPGCNQTPVAMPGCNLCGTGDGCGNMPWAPPGIARPWPADEYICDGGDRNTRVWVGDDFQLSGLDPEDTIGHYDTLDGRIVIEQSNRVCIYAPRFACVRKVDPIISSQQNEAAVGTHAPQPPLQGSETKIATTTLQQTPPIGEIGIRRPILLRERNPAAVAINELSPRGFQDRYKAYEDFSVIKTGIFQEEEKAYLAQKTLAAIVWTKDVGAQVTIDNRNAVVAIGDRRAQAEYTVDLPTHPRLRLCKVASTDAALPGEIIDFTLRYDNTGDQVIGNVTIADSLTTRLEFVPGSAQSSHKTNFSTKINDADSLVLRWEIVEPVKPGTGGVLRFQCKVR